MNKKEAMEPISGFVIYFLVFLVLYSLIANCVEDVLLVSGDAVLAKVIKRIVEFLLFLVFTVFLHRKGNIEMKYSYHLNIGVFVIAFIFLFSAILLYEGTVEKLIDTYFNFEINIGNSEDLLEDIFKIPAALFIQTCITAPIFEEIIMRGYVFRVIAKKYSFLVGLVINSLFFALLHFDFVNSLFYFMIGAILTYVFYKTGSILYCILLHFLVNFIAVLSHYLQFNMVFGDSVLMYIILLIALIGSGYYFTLLTKWNIKG